jgi:hypothetical protein
MTTFDPTTGDVCRMVAGVEALCRQVEDWHLTGRTDLADAAMNAAWAEVTRCSRGGDLPGAESARHVAGSVQACHDSLANPRPIDVWEGVA